jgi:glucose/arabinose dehydrogenase
MVCLATFSIQAQESEQTDPTLTGPHVLIVRSVNVRQGPSTNDPIIAVARPGERYTITAKNAAGTWWQIDYLGEEGWLYASLVDAINAEGVSVASEDNGQAVSITSTPEPAASQETEADEQQSGEAAVAIRGNMNVRRGPGTAYGILTVARPGERYPITGRNSEGSWWRIDLDGQDGWVYAPLVAAENTGDVAVVDVSAAPVASSVTAGNSPTTNTAAAPATTAFDPATVQLRLQPVFGGLNQPTYVIHAGDGSGRLFVTERPGRIKVFTDPEADGKVFLDIEDRVSYDKGEQGLLGLAFPPNFRNTGTFFINYTNKDGDTIVARYQVSGDNHNRADRDSEEVILFLDQPAPNHNGGMLLFGPDGKLWIGTGDGGGANDTYGNGQNGGTLFGAMLRLDVSEPGVPYHIPADNPYVGDDGVLDEIWAIGLRNPWRYSFDPQTGALWIGDVGESLFEEINYVSPAQVRQGGLNFGWPVTEGMHCAGNRACDLAAYHLPLHEYGHDQGCSVTGGRVYRGSAFPVLNGVYFFSDFCSGHVWALWHSGGETQVAPVLPKAASLTSFGVDEAGELYVTDFGGVVHRLVAD